MSYIAANGQEITEAMIDSWCNAYEHGEFPEGEHTVGECIQGQPHLSFGQTTSFNVNVSANNCRIRMSDEKVYARLKGMKLITQQMKHAIFD